MKLATLETYISADLGALGLKALPVPLSEGPDTFERVREAYGRGGFVPVWSGGSDRTIWSGPRANWAFRAWHDGFHVATGADFTMAGEAEACRASILALPRSLRRTFGPVLRAEIIGQAQAFFRTGDFPAEQTSFFLSYLEGARA